MALKKAITTREGFQVEYWRVNPQMSIDFENRHAVASILVYKDEAARRAGMSPVHTMLLNHSFESNVSLSGAELDAALLTGDVRAAMYAQIKTQDFFLTSEDA